MFYYVSSQLTGGLQASRPVQEAHDSLGKASKLPFVADLLHMDGDAGCDSRRSRKKSRKRSASPVWDHDGPFPAAATPKARPWLGAAASSKGAGKSAVKRPAAASKGAGKSAVVKVRAAAASKGAGKSVVKKKPAASKGACKSAVKKPAASAAEEAKGEVEGGEEDEEEEDHLEGEEEQDALEGDEDGEEEGKEMDPEVPAVEPDFGSGGLKPNPPSL